MLLFQKLLTKNCSVIALIVKKQKNKNKNKNKKTKTKIKRIVEMYKSIHQYSDTYFVYHFQCKLKKKKRKIYKIIIFF